MICAHLGDLRMNYQEKIEDKMTTQSDPIPYEPSGNESQREQLSRRQFLTLFALGGGAAALSACGSTVIPAPTESPAGFEGYSIFHETMVDMPWPEIKQAAQEGAIVLLPIAVIEEHGPHLGLGCDLYMVYYWCKMTRRALEVKGIRALIAPPNYWGISQSTSSYPGTFSVRTSTLKGILLDIHASLHQWGFKYVFTFNLHGDSAHKRVFEEAVQEAHEQLGMGAYYIRLDSMNIQDMDYAIEIKTPPLPESLQRYADTHAGARETADMAIYFPKIVNADLARTLKPSTSFDPLGYWGDPASFEKINPEEIKRWEEAIETFLKNN
jgi:creatinine amidohydrolase